MFRIAGAAAVLCLAGCGGSNLAHIEGTVTYGGQPVKDGTIAFHPAKGRPANGKIVDGKIVEVTTESANDGAPLGPVKVTVVAISNPGDMKAKQKSLVPDKYGDPEKSGLTAEIKAGTNVVQFDLK